MKSLEVLLIDDDPFQIELLTGQLDGLGCGKIRGFVDVAQALDVLASQSADIGLIFLDLNMPGTDGVEVLRRLADRRYDGSLVLISGEDSRIVEAAARLARAHDLDILGWLAKPCGRGELSALLDLWQETRKPVRHRSHKRYAPARIAQAIAQGELKNVYQPKVFVRDGMLAGVETLVRWQHPQDGIVYPDQFIATAEEHGLIGRLTRTVIDRAIDQIGEWSAQGRRIPVAVNISMEDVSDPDFASYVLEALDRGGVSPSELTLEVTESRLMTNARAAMETLTRLRLRRVNLSIDDFGTGHSSLMQLRDLPFSELKIDRGFVHGAVSNATIAAIFDGSIDLARRLGMTTVAEGVELEADWNWLGNKGCDIAQGYFVARPMAADEVMAWARAWEAASVGSPKAG